MKKLWIAIVVACVLAASSVNAVPARLPSSGGGGFSPVVAEIGQQLQELVTGDPEAEIVPEETFGTRALGLVLSVAKHVTRESGKVVANFAALPQLSKWYEEQKASETKSKQWTETGGILAVALFSAFLARWGVMLALVPSIKRIQKRAFPSSFARFSGALARFGLTAIPVCVFLACALFVVDQTQTGPVARFLVMAVIYALTVFQVFKVLLRFLFSPRSEVLRIVPVSASNALFVKRWGDWYGGILIFGSFLTEIAGTLKLPEQAIFGFKGLLTLLVAGMTIGVIVRKRRAVSSLIKGDITADGWNRTLWQSLRLWLARVWHVLAIVYLVVGSFVTMAGAENGFLVMQKGTVGTLFILLLVWFALHLLSFSAANKEEGDASSLYKPVLRLMARLVTWLSGVAAVAAVWGVPVAEIASNPWGQRVLGSAFSITATVLVLVAVYEAVRYSIDRKLNRRDAFGNVIEADARSRTLLPMVHNVSLFVLVLIAGLVTLSELGVDTGPLLAGAGVLGVAVGFGSQTLVKDFLIGLSILIEGTMAVGDVVRLGEHEGVVEGMTIRAVKLRERYSGALYVVPFSDITRVVNLTKGYSFAPLDVDVAYDSDLEKVMAVMERVGNALAQDLELKDSILEPVEILGVEVLGSSSVTIRGRVKTRPGRQWVVRRAFLLRIKQAFDAEKIEIPFPHVVHVTKEA